MRNEEFAEALKTLGWTQREAAGELRVTEGAVSRWVREERGIPGPVGVLMGERVERHKRKVARATARNPAAS